jgi:hypothetical protein|tara:strand:- start:437 stop:730 length:294 start_codon:yes stop_codon:yes gene_type:complete
MLLGNLQPLAPPDALYALVIHDPAFGFEKGRDPPVTVAAILAGKADDVRGQRLLIVRNDRPAPLRRPGLFQIPADPALRKIELLLNMNHTPSAALGA